MVSENPLPAEGVSGLLVWPASPKRGSYRWLSGHHARYSQYWPVVRSERSNLCELLCLWDDLVRFLGVIPFRLEEHPIRHSFRLLCEGPPRGEEQSREEQGKRKRRCWDGVALRCLFFRELHHKKLAGSLRLLQCLRKSIYPRARFLG